MSRARDNPSKIALTTAGFKAKLFEASCCFHTAIRLHSLLWNSAGKRKSHKML